MALPHPQSRKEHKRNDDISNTGCVCWKYVKRAINIPEYRYAEDEVNAANNCTFGGIFHDSIPPLTIFEPPAAG
jgi:hypothetical protein